MKKIIIGLALALLTLGCAKEYDDSALTARVDQLEKDVKDIKAQLKDLNSQVAGVNAAIEAWKAGGFVQSITEVKEGNTVKGYTITFVGGQTVTIYHGEKGEQGNPGTPGNPGNPGAAGHSPVVTVGPVDGYDGLYWLVDGEPLKVDDKPVPATVLPTFTINAEGHLIATVGGVETDLGTVVGVGDSLIDEITPGADAVTFKLNDGTTFDIPMAKAFKLVIETKDFEVAAGATKEIAYDVQNADESTEVNFFANNSAFKVSLDATAKKIKVTVPDPFTPGEVLVWAQNDKGLTSLVKLSFIQAAGLVVVTDETNYQTIAKDGGDVVVNLTSNVDVDVKTPSVDWVQAVVTKAEYKLTLTLEANPSTEPRETEIEIIRKDNGNTVQTIKIIQLGGELVMPDAKVDDVLWAETFEGTTDGTYLADYKQTGTSVFGGFKVKYSVGAKPEGGSDMKVYVDAQMKDGVNQGNVLISRKGGTWTISGIPTGNAKKARLNIKVNGKRNLVVTTATEGVTVGERVTGTETAKPYTYYWDIDFADVKLFTITFTNQETGTNNIRVDDINLVVTEAGEGGGETPKVLTIEKVWGKYPTEWPTFTSNLDRCATTDGEYVYVAKAGSGQKGIWAISIADPTQVKEVCMEGVETEGTFPTSCVRNIYNPETGKYILLLSNMSMTGNEHLYLYAYDKGIDQAPTKLLSDYTLPDWAERRFGDFFTVVGDWSNGYIWFRTNTSGASTTARFTIQNGALKSQTPDGFAYGYGASQGKGSFYQYSMDAKYGFLVTDSIGMFYDLNSGEGQIWTAPATQENMRRMFGVTPFEFNGEKYIAYTKMKDDNAARSWLRIIKDKGTAADFKASLEENDIVYQHALQIDEEGQSTNVMTGATYSDQTSASCAVAVTEDAVYIVGHHHNVGLSVFKMYMK